MWCHCYIQFASHTATQRFIKYNEFILNKVQVQSFLLHCSCRSVFFDLDFISTNLTNRWLRSKFRFHSGGLTLIYGVVYSGLYNSNIDSCSAGYIYQ